MTPVAVTPTPVKVALRCDRCHRVVAYKLTSTSGLLQIKCPKCGKELALDLSLRRAKTPIYYRRAHKPLISIRH